MKIYVSITLYKLPSGGGTTRPFPRDGGAEEFRENPTVSPHSKVWTRIFSCLCNVLMLRTEATTALRLSKKHVLKRNGVEVEHNGSSTNAKSIRVATAIPMLVTFAADFVALFLKTVTF